MNKNFNNFNKKKVKITTAFIFVLAIFLIEFIFLSPSNFYIDKSRIVFLSVIFINIYYFVFFFDTIKNKPEISYVILFITFAIFIAVIVPPKFSYDEKEHFIRAYQMSWGDFGFGEGREIPWSNASWYVFNINPTEPLYNNMDEKINFLNHIIELSGEMISTYYHSTAITYLFVPYIPYAVGLFIARCLNLSFLGSYVFGRVFMILVSAYAGYFILKKARYGKSLLFLIMLLPSTIYLFSFYSADTMLFFSLTASMVMYFNMITAKEHSLSFKPILFFAIFILIAASCKINYLPLGLLLFTVPNKNFNIKKPLRFKFFVFIIAIVCAVLIVIYNTSFDLMQWPIEGADPESQFLFIIENPLEYLMIFANHIRGSFHVLITENIGKLAYSGSLSFNIVAILNIIIVLTALLEKKVPNFHFSKKIVLLLLLLITALAIVSILYITFTPLGSMSINGVQIRYYLPLLFPLLMLLNNDIISIKISSQKKNIILYFITIIPLISLVVHLKGLYIF